MRRAILRIGLSCWLMSLAICVPAHAQAKLMAYADTPLRAGLTRIAEVFRRDTGHEVEFFFGPSPVILRKLADGESPDVLLAQPNHVADLVKAGKIPAGDYPVLGRMGLGLAVRAGAPARPVRSVDELRQLLLAADTLVTNTIIPGDLFVGVLERLGIASQVQAKLVRLPPGPQLYQRVINGAGNDITAGILPILMETPGLAVLGGLPPQLQPYQSYAAAPLASSASAPATLRFLAYLGTPAARELLAASGVE